MTGAAASAPLADLAAAVDAAVSNPQINQLLHGIIDRTLGNPARIKSEIADWFDNAMDRLSGAYKRWSQLVSVIIALVIAVGLNVDAPRIAQTLWQQPQIVEKLKLNSAAKDVNALVQQTDVKALVQQMNEYLPVGWSRGFFQTPDGTSFTVADWGRSVPGWLLAALSTLFGAPFWFDLLQRAVQLKGAGPAPGERIRKGGSS